MKTSISIATCINTTPILIVAFLLAVVVPACDSTEEEEETRVVPAEVITIETGTIIRRFGYTGDIEGRSEIKVFAPIPDRVISLSAREGERVKRGEVLAVIRSKQLSQSVSQAAGAQAQVRQLEATLGQAKQMKGDAIIPAWSPLARVIIGGLAVARRPAQRGTRRRRQKPEPIAAHTRRDRHRRRPVSEGSGSRYRE